MGGLLRYFQEARAELVRVTWPTRAQVLEGTQVVLAFIVVMTLVLFALDHLLGTLLRAVIAQ